MVVRGHLCVWLPLWLPPHFLPSGKADRGEEESSVRADLPARPSVKGLPSTAGPPHCMVLRAWASAGERGVTAPPPSLGEGLISIMMALRASTGREGRGEIVGERGAW